MCTYQGRIPNEDQILCKNMVVVYLKIYKCYNAALNKHHKKMSSTIKFNPIILCVYLVKHAFGWYCWMLYIPGCPYSRYNRHTFLSNQNVNKRLRSLCFADGGPLILPCFNQCIYVKKTIAKPKAPKPFISIMS